VRREEQRRLVLDCGADEVCDGGRCGAEGVRAYRLIVDGVGGAVLSSASACSPRAAPAPSTGLGGADVSFSAWSLVASGAVVQGAGRNDPVVRNPKRRDGPRACTGRRRPAEAPPRGEESWTDIGRLAKESARTAARGDRDQDGVKRRLPTGRHARPALKLPSAQTRPEQGTARAVLARRGLTPRHLADQPQQERARGEPFHASAREGGVRWTTSCSALLHGVEYPRSSAVVAHVDLAVRLLDPTQEGLCEKASAMGRQRVTVRLPSTRAVPATRGTKPRSPAPVGSRTRHGLPRSPAFGRAARGDWRSASAVSRAACLGDLGDLLALDVLRLPLKGGEHSRVRANAPLTSSGISTVRGAGVRLHSPCTLSPSFFWHALRIA